MTTTDVLRAVISAAAKTYHWSDAGPVSNHGESAPLFHLTVPKFRRFERVCLQPNDLEDSDLTTFQEYRESGFDVWVLVPIQNMGKAHSRFRGRVDRIQPWWFDEKTRDVKFGTAETP